MEVNDFELSSKIELLRNDINLYHQVLNIEAGLIFDPRYFKSVIGETILRYRSQ